MYRAGSIQTNKVNSILFYGELGWNNIYITCPSADKLMMTDLVAS